MAKRKTTWEVRFRSPISDTKGVDTREIETNSDDEPNARVVAQWALDRDYAHPASKLVYVRKKMWASEDEMLETQGRKPKDDEDTVNGSGDRERVRGRDKEGTDRAASAAGAAGRVGQ